MGLGGGGERLLTVSSLCGHRRPLQWLPESARYDVLTGNHDTALATLQRVAAQNGVPMPLGKLVAARQVGALCPGTRRHREPSWESDPPLLSSSSLHNAAGEPGEVPGLVFPPFPMHHRVAVVHMVNIQIYTLLYLYILFMY